MLYDDQWKALRLLELQREINLLTPWNKNFQYTMNVSNFLIDQIV